MKPTDALNSNFIGITSLHVSGSLSAHHQEFLVVHRHWYIFADLMTVCYQKQDGTAVQFHLASGSKGSSNLQKCTNADLGLRTPDDGQKGCPKHVET